jgi:cutinase
MIYARGTWEPGEPPSQVAAPLLKALEKTYPGKIDFRNAKYDGGASGYLGGGAQSGIDEMTKVTTRAVTSCPNSTLLMIGYR